MTTEENAIPPHLRRFVVRQDYSQYTEEDQAVWRFVVRQTHENLRRTAHPAYAEGFHAAGISVDKIPNIEEMSERLSRFGWRAVSVDGFIPPRAFQAFQARGILPVASDIRASKHLTYTPAPDIIHEAAGHAPFLADADYGAFVRRIGAAAEHAFASPADRDLYLAIFTLSEVKENPSSTPSLMARAEQGLERAVLRMGTPSEAAKLARLYWWTAEYGLVGNVDDFLLYGAGLLSSIGESHFCHTASVKKQPLSAACVDVDYDITRAQPQLFVARDLAQLGEVLDEVTATLAFRIGGERALTEALCSEELATLELDSGVEVAGIVTRIHHHDEAPCLIELAGPCAVARGGVVLDAWPRPARYALPVGVLEDGTPLSNLSLDTIARRTSNGVLALRLTSGLDLRGRVCATDSTCDRVALILMDDFELKRGDEVLFQHAPPYPLALGQCIRTARASAPHGFHPPTSISPVTVPGPRTLGAAGRELVGLYDRAFEAWRKKGSAEAATEYEQILSELDVAFPDDWLLRMNLLEGLVKSGERADLSERIEADLERLEVRFDHLEPIATGLSHVRSLARSERAPGDGARSG